MTPEQDHIVDRALQQALRPAPLPEDFGARLMNAVLKEGVQDLQVKKRELDLEYEQTMRRLHRGHVRVQRDTLVMLLVVAFAAGACATVALPWLERVLGIDMAIALPMVALVTGLCSVAGLLARHKLVPH